LIQNIYNRHVACAHILTETEILDALRDAGSRTTSQRMVIVEYLAGRRDHPSARQIYETVRVREPKISLTTVYNTLKTLVAEGLVREIEFNEVENRFDTNLAPHANLVCKSCGSIVDLDEPLPISVDEVLRRKGFEATEFRVEYRGVCGACRDRRLQPRG
jgi:Fe2+ or Zn2+ uptake regulation protein